MVRYRQRDKLDLCGAILMAKQEQQVFDNLAKLGIYTEGQAVHIDLCAAELVQRALQRGEGELSSTGSLVVRTGEYTGRSPKSRYIVDTPNVHDRIAWGNVNRPIDTAHYEALRDDVCSYLGKDEVFVMRSIAAADRRHARSILVVAERASQALFARQMLVRPHTGDLDRFNSPDFTLLAAPGFLCDPERHGTGGNAGVLINFAERIIIVAGSGYSGEIKKAVFSTMNYLLPTEDGVLSMHCSANRDPRTRETAVFFGLSGTGKTTLSAVPGRQLIGDDEHGWSDECLFNIEGGCYAKCIDLTAESEPLIFKAIRFGSVTENVILDRSTHIADYTDASITENTRVAYPVGHIEDARLDGIGQPPSVVVFLTADAFGVLPPIARLTPEAAMYHFLTGFTAKVAGTEQGIVEPVPTFSALFGEPFMPLDPLVYAHLLEQRINAAGARVYLVNTGWTEGGYGTGHRMSLEITRALVNAALDGSIDEAGYRHDDRFNVDVPVGCEGVPSELLEPRLVWPDAREYDAAADKLARMFQENFEKRYPSAEAEIKAAGPRPLA